MITAKSAQLQPRYDVAVVGAGAAGMAAAVGARDAGAERILLIDREREAGGILLQCIHNGFGLHHFGEELTGPEYAARFLEQVADRGVDIVTDTFVADVAADKTLTLMSGDTGVRQLQARSVVLAMGARERTRGAIRIPGTRPAGVMTAGLAQRFVNMLGVLPGRRAVILGSGDIGLIMARRLTLEGVEVVGVYEIMPHANGLNRNIVQCLQDFDIPLYLSTTVVEIHGHDRVEGVTVAPVDEALRPDLSRAQRVDCDTLLLSIGLVPENELSRLLRLRMDPLTGGPLVSSTFETSMDGVFACGNVVHINDLVDWVSDEAAFAGRWAAEELQGRRPPADNVRLLPGDHVASVVPQSISTDREHTVFVRARSTLEKSAIRFGEVYTKKLRYVCPAETIAITLKPAFLDQFPGGALRIDIYPRE
ncbi:MAG TPA: FAD/NAD(P)-binding oxidoreductase [Candidatus Limnocylindrales bacterium]|nr:FAD/NAD(P)-binding oxidoreductase [Candidatus Limnocylindrales bacterium]